MELSYVQNRMSLCVYVGLVQFDLVCASAFLAQKKRKEIAIITVTWCEQSEWIYVKLCIHGRNDPFVVSRYQQKKEALALHICFGAK